MRETVPVAFRLLTSGLATALGQWALAIASLLAMGLEPTTWWLGLSGVLTAVVSVWAYRLVVRRPGDAGPEDDDSSGGGGGPPPDAPEDPPDPPWWPAFERAFRDHADRREPAGLTGARPHP